MKPTHHWRVLSMYWLHTTTIWFGSEGWLQLIIPTCLNFKDHSPLVSLPEGNPPFWHKELFVHLTSSACIILNTSPNCEFSPVPMTMPWTRRKGQRNTPKRLTSHGWVRKIFPKRVMVEAQVSLLNFNWKHIQKGWLLNPQRVNFRVCVVRVMVSHAQGS